MVNLIYFFVFTLGNSIGTSSVTYYEVTATLAADEAQANLEYM